MIDDFSNQQVVNVKGDHNSQGKKAFTNLPLIHISYK